MHAKPILCVEDEPDTCEMLSQMLEAYGYQIVSAKTIAEALSLSMSRQWALYLLDLRLPDGSGLDLCKRIRKLDQKTPIIFFSSAACETVKDLVFEAGAQIYIQKPDVYNELMAVIVEMLRNDH